MTTVEANTYEGWIGQQVIDSAGEKIGKVSQIYVEDQTGQPAWLTVKTGLFGGRSSFVPLQGARASGDTLVVACDKDMIKDAPRIDDDGALSAEEEQQLYNYYGQMYGSGVGTEAPAYGSPRPSTDDAMTRSEERLAVGTARQEVGRARLRKYVVTENVQTTVPVSHEEVRVEREPITDANRDAALSGPDITEAEHEVVLTEERPVVQRKLSPWNASGWAPKASRKRPSSTSRCVKSRSTPKEYKAVATAKAVRGAA